MTMNANGLHVAIIMDGNGRWATGRGLPRVAGHRAGAEAARRIVELAPDLGIEVLTLFAFSCDNWTRPPAEVSGIFTLARRFLRRQARERHRGVRVDVIGRRDRLDAALLRSIEAIEHDTAGERKLHLRIALDYSARDAIARAALRWSSAGEPSIDELGRLIAQAGSEAPLAPDVDLLIRTGGERRLSDFLLWESAYAELHFTDRLWPDFGEQDLRLALEDFRGRERRFGAVSPVESKRGVAALRRAGLAATV
jgi:undecaprenyl diphosphate synthase